MVQRTQRIEKSTSRRYLRARALAPQESLDIVSLCSRELLGVNQRYSFCLTTFENVEWAFGCVSLIWSIYDGNDALPPRCSN